MKVVPASETASMLLSEGNTRADETGVKEPGFVVELLGPAAVGKSSLMEALTEYDEKFVVGVGLRRRRIGHVLYFLGNALLLLPMILRQFRKVRWFTWKEIKMLVYLKGWHHVLRRQTRNGSIVLMENSAVFMLIRLRAFGPGNLRSRSFDRWWAGMLKQWGNTLDMVIWIDAPDEILLERVHARGRRHRVMTKSREEASEFFARYRRSYEEVISALVANHGTRLLRLDTHQESLSQLRDKVLAAYDLGHIKSGSPEPKEVDSRKLRPSRMGPSR